jgi:superfamily II DNA or RNA helicase
MQKVVIEILSNVRARLRGASKDVLKFLDKNLAEIQKGSEWSPGHRRFGGKWDGKRHHFHISPAAEGQGTFSKGLLHRVRALLVTQGVRAKTRDLRKKVAPPIDLSTVWADMLHGVSMTGEYSYQLEAVKAALKEEAGILFMATNAGKTEISTAIIKALEGRTVLFVVPKKILLKQTRETIAERLGTIPEAIGTIGNGKFDPKEITVAIVNSVTPAKKAKSASAKRKNEIIRAYLKTVDCVFLDEGHHAKASSWARLMNAATNAQYRYVMSGTPFTGDNDLMVEAAAGRVIYEIRNDALIKLGVSAKPMVRLLTVDEPDLEDYEDQTYDGIYKAGVVNNDYRNKLIAREAASYSKQGKSVVVLIRILAQGTSIRQHVAAAKAPVEFAHGKMFDDERNRITEWFKEKPGRVLVGSAIFDEGVNIPQMNALIIGDGGKSLRAVLQKVGRSVRKKKSGANVVDVIDFADCTHHFLAKHSLERFDI